MKYICSHRFKCLSVYCDRKKPHKGKRVPCKASMGVPGAEDVPAQERSNRAWLAYDYGKKLGQPKSKRGIEKQ